jgi:hypothetical protein
LAASRFTDDLNREEEPVFDQDDLIWFRPQEMPQDHGGTAIARKLATAMIALLEKPNALRKKMTASMPTA